MLIDFFFKLKAAKLPVSLKEFLTLLEAMEKGVIEPSAEEFYYLARTTMVKDESNFDKFDRAFAEYFEGAEALELEQFDIPEDWLKKLKELNLSPEDMAAIEAMGGLEKLLETLKKRMEEQKERHEGGNKWLGTGGTSPYGAYGYNPEGIRIGQETSRHRRAVKVWDERHFQNLDAEVELGTRNIKVALRRLRQFARQGASEELDMDETIHATAKNAGWLDLHMRPERHNAVKVLLLLDIGGSMDDHIRLCEELFSACKTEFKHLEHYYFHNCLYESVWRDNHYRRKERTPTMDLLHKYGSNYKVIFVGDATMGPYEITHVGGSVEHDNEEPGIVWMRRVLDVYPKAIWLNPEAPEMWPYRRSIQQMRDIMSGRMYPMTLEGLEQGMAYLSK